MQQFVQQKAPPQPVYKNYNERVDIITGELLDKNTKNAGYERFTEASQSMASSNKNQMPSDLAV